MELNLILLILLHLSCFSCSLVSSLMEPLCNEHDQVALLQFKKSFSLDHTNCPNPNPHLSTWVLHNKTNSTAGCCTWEGVTCEVLSGRVTGIDLSYACLHGPINSTNPIFRMPHLQQINLAGNDFAQSQIPSAFGKFLMLNNLNLSQASFSGSIPQEMLELSSLTSLDLSGIPSLHLPMHGLASIAQNMKGLTELSLSQVNISSAVPKTFANISSLRMLQLEDCNLQDHFPVGIFLLPRLEHLNVMNNPDLYGHLPEFPIGSTSLISLELSSTQFQSELPGSIGNLISLQLLNFWKCNFSGSIPYSIGKLVNITLLGLSHNKFSGSIPSSLENLTSVTNLSLSYNPFSPSRLSWIGNLTKLKGLYLSSTNLYGSIPFSLSKLKQIEELSLWMNYLSGHVPSWIGNLTRLTYIGLSGNNLDGQIPSSIFSLRNLERLYLQRNNLSGIVDISMFHEQIYIKELILSDNQLSVVSNKFLNFSLPNLELLHLESCNLREFPLFLKNQDRLKVLSLTDNNLSGEIPAWFLNVSTKSMVFLVLNQNLLTRFEQPVVVLPWSKLEVIDLSFNHIHGSLPLPPPSMSIYILSNNFMGGELSPTFCKATTLSALELSNNELVGIIPDCLGNLGSSLLVLDLKGNKFEGKIPHIHTDRCSLQLISLSQNQIKGKLPRTLAKCRDLEILDVGNNQITDTFPSWLGTLPKLQALILKMNNFHGPMGSPSSMADFPELSIIDLSGNALTGALPSEYFPLWKAMKKNTEKQSNYLLVSVPFNSSFGNSINNSHFLSTAIMNKGTNREYDQLSTLMVFISLSGNKFGGEIPESIGDLVELVGLDLSNNNLSGLIPAALGKLKGLESLDLSLNMLSGEIPQQLSQLTFLEFLNVSYNNLSGTIPRGGQLGTFGNNSFNENPGLCGFPLLNKCGGVDESAAAHEGQDQGSSDHTKLVLGFEGFATGLPIGLGIGYIIATRNHLWFERTYLKLRYRK